MNRYPRSTDPKFRTGFEKIDCDIGSIIVKGHHFAVKVTHFKSHKISAKFWELREIWEIREFDFPKVEIFASINKVTLVAAKKPLIRKLTRALIDRGQVKAYQTAD